MVSLTRSAEARIAHHHKETALIDALERSGSDTRTTAPAAPTGTAAPEPQVLDGPLWDRR